MIDRKEECIEDQDEKFVRFVLINQRASTIKMWGN